MLFGCHKTRGMPAYRPTEVYINVEFIHIALIHGIEICQSQHFSG
jgi:hypothetical protein